METTNKHPLRRPCASCNGNAGVIRHKSGQDCVWCDCGKYQYNAPRSETGKKPRKKINEIVRLTNIADGLLAACKHAIRVLEAPTNDLAGETMLLSHLREAVEEAESHAKT